MARIRELMALGVPASVARALGHNLIAQFAAAGQDQASATPLPTNYAVLTNNGPATRAVRIGSATGSALSIYYNAGPNQLQIYPDEGDAFQDLQPDVPLPLYPFETAILVPSGDSWLVMAATPPGVTQGPGGSSGQIQINNAGNFGGITISGDAVINGTGVATVQGLQGRSVDAAMPFDKQVLEWSQATRSWGPGNIPVGPQGPPGPPAGAYIGPTPPPSPSQGEFWWDNLTGQLFISYDDGNSQQFVISNIGVAGPPGPPGTAAATIASAPPSGQQPGDLYWNNTTGQLFILYDDGTSRQYVVANTFPSPAFLPLTGGALTGPLVVNLNAQPPPAVPAGAQGVLRLAGADGAIPDLVFDGFSGTPQIRTRFARGSAAAPAAVAANDGLGLLIADGFDGTTYGSGGYLQFSAAANWTPSSHPASCAVILAAAGSTTPQTKLTVGGGLMVWGSNNTSPPGGPLGDGTINAAGNIQAGGNIFASNYISSRGATAGFQFEDRANPGQEFFLYATGGAAYLLDQQTSVTTLEVDGSGNLYANGIIEAKGNVIYCGTTGSFFLQDAGNARNIAVANNCYFQYAQSTQQYVFIVNGTAVCFFDPNSFTIAGATATKPGGGSWAAPSDRSLKSTVETWPTGLAEVLQLQPISYRYNNEEWNLGHVDHIGLDAEDATAVIPEMGRTIDIQVHADPQETASVSAIDHTPLVFALVNAVRELSARLDQIVASLPPAMKPPMATQERP